MHDGEHSGDSDGEPDRPDIQDATSGAAPSHRGLPDEDAFVVPVQWRRYLHPRRGGVTGPSLATKTNPETAAQELVTTLSDKIARMLDHRRSKPDLVELARDQLNGAAVTPRGAAIMAGIAAHSLPWGQQDKAAVFADAWLATQGVVFAAQAIAELGGLSFGDQQAMYMAPSPRNFVGSISDHEDSHGARVGWGEIARRVRAYLAAATEDDYQQACEALGEYRSGVARQRMFASYLVPTQTAWVDQDCAYVLSQGSVAGTFLLCSIGAVAQLNQVAPRVEIWSAFQAPGVAMTLAEGVGPAAARAMAQWCDDAYDAETKRRLLAILATFPTDEAFGLLVDRLDQKYVQPALIEAMSRYPVRALRLLGTAAGGRSTIAKISAELVRGHVKANPDLVATARPTLPAPVQQDIEALTRSTPTMPEANAEMLPAVLLDPVWTSKRTRPKPAIVEGITATVTPSMAWLPGEREAWAASQGPDFSHGTEVDWNGWAKELRANRLLTWKGGRFFAQAPEDLARPLLATWRPAEMWNLEEWSRCIVARFELEALPPILYLVRPSPAAAAALLMPFATAEVATMMADWFARLKSVRAVAQAWLVRHPTVAAQALVPAALGKPGKGRSAAEGALRMLAGQGHRPPIVAAARSYGERAATDIEQLLDIDPLEIVPARIPALPEWADPALLPPVLLRERTHALPLAAVRHLGTMLAISKPGEVYAGVELVKQACDPQSLAEFGWALFVRWQMAGLPSSAGWVLDALGWVGDDETVRRLAPIIRAWPGEGGTARAVRALEVLASIGTDVALMHLHGISQRVKFAGLKARAGEKIAEVAADLGLTPEQLADRLVPDLGLDADGSATLDYGTRRFMVGFDEQLKPYVADAAGKRLKDLPKPGARDDAALAGAAYQRFSALKKDVRTIAADQIRRLEQAMVWQRRWTGTEFRDLLVGHPLLWHLVRRLVWASYRNDGELAAALRVAEDRSFATVDDDAIGLDDEASVGIAHPLQLGATLAQWSEVFADYEILQPFPQLGREVHRLTEAERNATELERYGRLTVPTVKVLGLERRGWVRGLAEDGGVQGWVYRVVPGGRAAVISLDPGIIVGAVTDWPEQTLTSVWVNSRPEGDWRASGSVRFGELDAVTASEILRDLTELAG